MRTLGYPSLVKRNANPFGSGGGLVRRGSKSRIRRLRARDHLGWWGLAFALLVLFLFLVAVPFLGRLSHH